MSFIFVGRAWFDSYSRSVESGNRYFILYARGSFPMTLSLWSELYVRESCKLRPQRTLTTTVTAPTHASRFYAPRGRRGPSSSLPLYNCCFITPCFSTGGWERHVRRPIVRDLNHRHRQQRHARDQFGGTSTSLLRGPCGRAAGSRDAVSSCKGQRCSAARSGTVGRTDGSCV